jgi:hypothetical protein
VSDAAWSKREGGVTLTVRLTPRAGRDAIEGCERRDDGRAVLKARVRAAPQEGEANAALTRLIAQALGAPASAVTLLSGGSARTKILAVAGDPEALAARLAALAAGQTKDRR